MNSGYIETDYTHTVTEKLTEYFIEPLTNYGIIFILIVMFANAYMFRKLWKIKRRDYIEIINYFTIGLYSVVGIISAVIVSNLGPHGKLMADDCDKEYMFIPRILFTIVAILNIVYFVINIITKLKKDEEYKKTEERGYFAEEVTNEDAEEEEEKTEKDNNKNNHVHIEVSSVVDNIKEKINIDRIKEKANSITEDIKEIINSKINRDE